MPVLPKTRIGQLEFFETHQPAWAAAADEIGLTAAQLAALAARTAAARAAYDQQQAAISAARAATLRFHLASAALHAEGAGALRSIRVTAGADGGGAGGGDDVYSLARIPPPAARGRIGPPGTPFDFRVQLLPAGGLRLTWKCRHPRGAVGTLYEVRRRVEVAATAALLLDDTNGEIVAGRSATGSGRSRGFEYLGSTGVKSFTDRSLPRGAASAIYELTALRSTARGQPARFTVQFSGPARPAAAALTRSAAVHAAPAAAPATC
jgi:hypothetical protein